jgi:DNA topoisomerase VI subunit B
MNNELMPSSVAFYRITTSIINLYDRIIEDELTTGSQIQLTMQPYLVGKVAPSNAGVYLENLQELSQLFKDNGVSQGIFREFLTLLEIDRNQAEQAMRRWYDNMEKRQQQDLLTQLKEILEKMGFDQQPPDSLQFIGSEIEKYERTPIGDALALVKVG